LNAINLGIAFISIQWEAVTRLFALLHKVGDTTEAEDSKVLIRIVAFEDATNGLDCSLILICGSSYVV